MISVCVVDDQTLLRQGLCSLLACLPDVQVVGEAQDGEEALSVIARTSPDVVLLDVRMPKLDGIGVLRELTRRKCLPPTLILTTFDDDRALIEGLAAGARGFLLKDVSAQQLGEAVRALASGRDLIQPTLTERSLRRMAELPKAFEADPMPDPLTPREKDVLRLMSAGYSNREIADLLDLSEGTVKNRASTVFSKLGVRDRNRALLRAAELGIL